MRGFFPNNRIFNYMGGAVECTFIQRIDEKQTCQERDSNIAFSRTSWFSMGKEKKPLIHTECPILRHAVDWSYLIQKQASFRKTPALYGHRI